MKLATVMLLVFANGLTFATEERLLLKGGQIDNKVGQLTINNYNVGELRPPFDKYDAPSKAEIGFLKSNMQGHFTNSKEFIPAAVRLCK